jgi:Phage minor structural protein GP20
MKTFVAYIRSVLSQRPFVQNVFAESNEAPTNEDKKGEETQPTTEPGKGEPPTTTPPTKQAPTNQTPDFSQAIAQARQDEKDKLYGEISTLKGKNAHLLDTIADRDQEIKGLKKDVDKLKGKLSEADEQLKEGTATNRTVSDLTTQINLLENQLEDLTVKYETEIENVKLESYRDKAIAGAGGEIIAELVSGSTQEEIDQSIEKAKTRYREITERAIQGTQMPRVNPSSNAVSLGSLSMDDIAKMSPEDYAKHRSSILKK